MKDLKSFEYKGHHVQIDVSQIGKRWHWAWYSDNSLSGECTESGAKYEEGAYREARLDAEWHIDASEK